jgi:hypothetical protein
MGAISPFVAANTLAATALATKPKPWCGESTERKQSRRCGYIKRIGMDKARRKLLFASAGGGALAAVLAACGGGGYSSMPAPPPPPPPPGTLSCGATAISDNHGHVLTIPAADVNSTVAKTYSIMGAATHDHTVTLTPAQLAMIKVMSAVVVTSTIGGSPSHSHDVTVNCA